MNMFDIIPYTTGTLFLLVALLIDRSRRQDKRG
jgi:hypothetical protein